MTLQPGWGLYRSNTPLVEKLRLLGISKRGNRYLRKILIHGARAAVLRLKRERAPMGAWMTALEARAPRNVLDRVATANKLARIAWALLSSAEDYRSRDRPEGCLKEHGKVTLIAWKTLRRFPLSHTTAAAC